MGRTNPNPTEDSCSSPMDSSSNHRHYHHPPTNSDLLSGASSSSPMLCGNGADHRASVVTVKRDLSTDLRLGLSASPPSNYHNPPSSSAHHSIQSQREQTGVEWPPIRPLLRSTLRGNAENISGRASFSSSSLFVKVNMEGIPIGRKLDLLAHDNYNELVSTLRDMFRTTISCPDADVVHCEERYCNNNHVLTYEDKEGDWMMVGDVPWEMFLSTVKRLKITRSDKC